MTKIRVIGGQWRGRRLDVCDRPGLRPTPDRVRETLFNWLQAEIPGARCLDMFAGTGALGLEALSRGAASVHFIENDGKSARQLQQHIETLGAQQTTELIQRDALRYLADTSEQWDIAFIDPPYHQALQQGAIDLLLPKLTSNAMVYVEQAGDEETLDWPQDLREHRSRRAGQVAYHLRIYQPESTNH